MLTVTITCEGKTLSDIEMAIDEAKKRIAEGNKMGFDSNDDGEFKFFVSGREIEIAE